MPGSSEVVRMDQTGYKEAIPAMLGAALLTTGHISNRYPDTVASTLEAIGSYGEGWMSNSGDERGNVLRAFIGQLIEMRDRADAKIGERIVQDGITTTD